MGLLQRALETYDNMSALVGKQIEGKSTLAPIGYISTKMKIEITITSNGDFVHAEMIDSEEIIIPVTEESAGRSSGARAHPLCDQVGYICDVDEEKHTLYLEQLKKWCDSNYHHPMVEAVYAYVSKGTVLSDLERNQCISREEDGNVKNLKDMIGWRVIGMQGNSGPVWENKELMHLYELFYREFLDSDASKEICFLSGNSEQIAKQHMKGVVSLHGNSKIISANDTSNYTYRGRFETSDEAVAVSYVASQKAHNALKWLIANDGVPFGNRVVVCWNPGKKEIPSVVNPLLPQRETESLPKPSEYKNVLKKIINGFQSQENAEKLQKNDAVVFAAFDAATSGRLSITYYSEQQAADYLNRLLEWDSSCCWMYKNFGVRFPSLYQIVMIAYGSQRGNDENAKIELDPKIKGEQMQRLLSCRISGAKFPKDIMVQMRHKADNIQIYSRNNRERLLFTVCAVIKKYRYDHWKEDWKMALEENKKDRSYQFGRLLAVMEKIEKDTYDSSENRETNAIRMQQKFVQRPFYTADKVMQKLKAAYLPRLSMGTRIYYDSLIGGIMEQLSEFSDDLNKPLSETYLLGYYLQKNALYTKKHTENDAEAIDDASVDIE